MSKYKKFFCMFLILLLAVCLLSTTAFAAGTGDVAGAIEGTWNDASDQIAGYGLLRLPQAWPVRMDSTRNPLCLPLVHADRPHLCVDHSGDVSQ